MFAKALAQIKKIFRSGKTNLGIQAELEMRELARLGQTLVSMEVSR